MRLLNLRKCSNRQFFCRFLLGSVAAACVFQPCVAQSRQSEQIQGAVSRLEKGNVVGSDVDLIASVGIGQSVLPMLEKEFESAPDADKKRVLASALVQLGDNKVSYWHFLIQDATQAVQTEVPYPYLHPTEDSMRLEFAPDFLAWTQAHGVDENSAAQAALFDLPKRVLLLAVTGDQRALPLLRRALHSADPPIVIFAAYGLAKLRDKQSITEIIAAVQKAPSEFRIAIAESLVYFDDSAAQSAVDTYLPKERAVRRRTQRAQGREVFGR